MPITLNPTLRGGKALAIFYSGDGGWAALDQGVASALAARGVPVVGVDSLRYFWTRRTADGAATDLAAIARHYAAAWGRSELLVVGYSFGADALPLIIERLPSNVRARIRLVALVGVDSDGELEVRPGDWLGRSGSGAMELAPALERLRGLKIICVYGDQEKAPACPAFGRGLAEPTRLPGGHHYEGAYSRIAEVILDAAPTR
jgi:type IV secretory pathway VirJ component